jgi:vancomycin resistance protein YoaR
MKKKMIVLIGVGLVVTIPLLLVVGFELFYANKIYPGLKVGGIDLGGLNRSVAEEKLSEKAKMFQGFTLRWGVNEWTIKAMDVDLTYDSKQSVTEAMSLGREGNILRDIKKKIILLTNRENANPIWRWNQEKLGQAIASVAAQINIPAQEPEITKSNANTVMVTPGQNGQELDIETLESKMTKEANTWSLKKIDLPISEIKPQLSDAQVNRVKDKANTIIGKTLTLHDPDSGQKWEISDDQLLTWLNLQTGEFDKKRISDWITELATGVNRDPQNASFRYVSEGRVEEFKPAKDGWRINGDLTANLVASSIEKLDSENSNQTVDLAGTRTKPIIDTAEVNNLGIKELLGKGESWFKGSITNRIFNLKKAAGILNGILVPPGEMFSFNKAVGEVSASTGYKQAYVIKEGKTVLGDGGGVCQVSSTLFRAVLAVGLPIEERVAHAYRVSYYEVNYQPGFDATVFQPSPDFKFRNDTTGYLLIQTVYDEAKQYLAFEIYGTSDGRKVEISKSRIWESVAPPPDLYQDDPTLAAGKIVQTEHSAWGAKVAFDWKVTRGDEILQQKTFYSSYRPWQAVFLRGTKTN